MKSEAAVTFARVSVVGAGAWGTALANVAARAGHDVRLWGRNEAAMAALASARENPRLPGVKIEQSVAPTSDLSAAAQCDLLLCVVPAQNTREMLRQLAPLLSPTVPVVLCSKGIERGTHKFMNEVLRDELAHNPAAVLSGPSFAADVSRGLPTAVTLAAEREDLAREIAAAISAPSFRLYHSDDLTGVEIGGAAKNVLAIACGIAAGRGLGASAGAALVARGFAELSRFGRAFGARPETLMGLSGLGDLVLTCGSTQSRNFSFGVALGQGKTPAEAAQSGLAEGAATAPVIVEIAAEKGVELPICRAVAGIVAGRLQVDEAVEALLARPAKAEG
jgi:glycerol-3-phosphate dehydrogenase (NAD(P)+)